ncbi:hypothetical protein BGX38DRAFT_1166007 [Terfezia claveryi]|nr:hypothetical protein BGX38DRAFT_1166007 [Terfezia claveryi]
MDSPCPCSIAPCPCVRFLSPHVPEGAAATFLLNAVCLTCRHRLVDHLVTPPAAMPAVTHPPNPMMPTTPLRPKKKKSPPNSPIKLTDSVARRERLVGGIYKRLCTLRFLHIRAPPATGKSTLLSLLYNYILDNNPGNLPIWKATSWWKPEVMLGLHDSILSQFLIEHTDVRSEGLWKRWLNWHAGFDWEIAHMGYWLLIDEGQLTYFDEAFWNDYLKTIDYNFPGYVVLFSSYGSPGDNPLTTLYPPPPSSHMTPIHVSEEQRISLQPRPWAGNTRRSNLHYGTAGDEGLGLLLTHDEYKDVVKGWNIGCNHTPPVIFGQNLLEGIYSFTQGHVGVVTLILQALANHRSIHRKINLRQPVMLEDLQETLFKTLAFHKTLLSGLAPAARTFPTVTSPDERIPSLQNPSIAEVFWFLIRHKRIREWVDVGDAKDQVKAKALEVCFRAGWVHADLDLDTLHNADSDMRMNSKVYILPSRCHEWYISCALVPLRRSDFAQYNLKSMYPTSFSFLAAVIKRFKPSQLRPLMPGKILGTGTDSLLGPGSKRRPPEALYRDEWYRSALHLLSKNSIRIMPEFLPDDREDCSRGWVDFHVPFCMVKGEGEAGAVDDGAWWRVGYTYEFLVEGRELDDHIGRFLPGGRYASWLPKDAEWLVVDFRTSEPRTWRAEYDGRLIYVILEAVVGSEQGDGSPAMRVRIVSAIGKELQCWVLMEAI